MLTRHERRMYKEGIGRLDSVGHGTLSAAKKYWLDQPEDRETLAVGLRSLHSVTDLPWPAETTLLVSGDNWFGQAIGRPTSQQLQLILHCADIDRDTRKQIGNVGRCGDSVYTMKSVATIAQLQVGLDGAAVVFGDISIRQLMCLDFGTQEAMRAFALMTVGTGRCDFEERCDAEGITEGIDDLWAQMKRFEESTFPESGTQIWVEQHPIHEAGDPAAIPGFEPPGGKTFGIGLGMGIFGALVALAFPCGYQVIASSRTGFGSSATRKTTAGEPVLCNVSYDRLRRLAEEAHALEGREVDPHFRRGHYRHMWKDAGLDRLTLPASAYERMKLVLERKVRRVYVRPAWVGKKEFSHDGWDWNIQAGEMEM